MRTIHQYEAQDIDYKDPVHGFLAGQVLLLFVTGLKPKEGEEPTQALKRLIAEFLNSAADQGIAISKNEIPAAFTG